MGCLVKRFLCPAWGVDPAKCYHCAVMPCYDKKLEAARDELMIADLRIPEVRDTASSHTAEHNLV